MRFPSVSVPLLFDSYIVNRVHITQEVVSPPFQQEQTTCFNMSVCLTTVHLCAVGVGGPTIPKSAHERSRLGRAKKNNIAAGKEIYIVQKEETV